MSDKIQPHSSEYPSSFRASCVSVGVALRLFLAGLDRTIMATAIPSIADNFHLSILWAGGKVYPFLSIKYAFLVAPFIFAPGSLISVVHHSFHTLY
ncbi:hypothetical protein EYZ11_011639 [Aspergillus tanneri]|uniref:Major facilitator superfamily (MFS) profile domain-containing protein n=2 Tax=Aspergillus tanneri TaxID=1220188 RepID=A0A4S3J2A4_9EURO|nr:hypothetical protein EYZ11_011639 [Aspergillus tanneri]